MTKPRLKESPGTNLMVALLIRYPELSTLRYNAESGRLTFHIYLKGAVELTQQLEFRQFVENYFAAWQEIDGRQVMRGPIRFQLLEEMTLLTYEQQLKSLQVVEVRLMMELIRDYYQGMFGDDVLLPLHEEELETQEEIIESILAQKENLREEKPILAYREGGRVFVYNR